jgi:hypothetical protein
LRQRIQYRRRVDVGAGISLQSQCVWFRLGKDISGGIGKLCDRVYAFMEEAQQLAGPLGDHLNGWKISICPNAGSLLFQQLAQRMGWKFFHHDGGTIFKVIQGSQRGEVWMF